MFFKSLIEMGGFELNHHWHGIDMLIVLECALLLTCASLLSAIFARWIKRSKRLTILSLVGALSFATAAYAANTALSGLSASGAIASANLIYVVQNAGVGGVKATFTQVATYINSLFSGDATVNSTGTVTLKNTGPGATGPLGSATLAPIVTIDAQGRVTALSSATVTPAVGSITGLGTGVGTALGTNVGTAGAFVANGGALGTPSSGTLTNATGLPLAGVTGWGTGVVAAAAAALNSSTGFVGALTPTNNNCVVGNGAAWTSAACPGGGGGVTSLTPGAALVSSVTAACSQSAITTTGTISAAECLNAQVGTSYAIVDGDRGKLITGTNSATQAYTIAQAGASTTFQSGWFARVQNKGTGPLTITPTTSTICGGSTLTIYPGQTQKITSDGTNYQCDGGTSGTVPVSSQTGANYAFQSSDFGKLVNLSNAANQIPTIAQAGTTGFPSGWFVQACNQGAGTQTITPTTSTIGGTSTLVLPAGSAGNPKCVAIVSDGSNYQIVESYLLPGTVIPNIIGTVSTQSGTTYTFAATDCGTTVRFSNASAVTATIPQGLPVGCNISIEQAGAGQVSVNGSAVTPATLHSAHSYTKTFAQWAVINVFTESSNVAVLTGDGA